VGIDIRQKRPGLHKKTINIMLLKLFDRALMRQTKKERCVKHAQKPRQIILDWRKGTNLSVNPSKKDVFMRDFQNRKKNKQYPNNNLKKKSSIGPVNFSCWDHKL
jgi:hypothetical protein